MKEEENLSDEEFEKQAIFEFKEIMKESNELFMYCNYNQMFYFVKNHDCSGFLCVHFSLNDIKCYLKESKAKDILRSLISKQFHIPFPNETFEKDFLNELDWINNIDFFQYEEACQTIDEYILIQEIIQ